MKTTLPVEITMPEWPDSVKVKTKGFENLTISVGDLTPDVVKSLCESFESHCRKIREMPMVRAAEEAAVAECERRGIR